MSQGNLLWPPGLCFSGRLECVFQLLKRFKSIARDVWLTDDISPDLAHLRKESPTSYGFWCHLQWNKQVISILTGIVPWSSKETLPPTSFLQWTNWISAKSGVCKQWNANLLTIQSSCINPPYRPNRSTFFALWFQSHSTQLDFVTKALSNFSPAAAKALAASSMAGGWDQPVLWVSKNLEFARCINWGIMVMWMMWMWKVWWSSKNIILRYIEYIEYILVSMEVGAERNSC